MRKFKMLFILISCSILSFGCSLVDNGGINVLYSEESNALYVFNNGSMTNTKRIDMDLRGDTLVFTRVSQCMILSNNRELKHYVYNNLKVILPPDVNYVKHRDFVCKISDLGRANDRAISKSHPFLLQIRPRKFPYSTR